LRYKRFVKFDPDIARTILLDIESIPPGTFSSGITIEGQDIAAVDRHLEILIDEGFVQGVVTPGNGGFPMHNGFFISDLTYKGHQFLESARNDASWNKAKETLREKGVGMTISFIQDVLVKIATSAISG